MLDSRRLFSSYQRRQILVAANYRCEVCAVLLDGEWHAHHRVAWSDGGPTETHNGMALCIDCHKRIHAMTFIPRQWQTACHEREREFRQTHGPGTKNAFLIEACPGAGKSAMAAMIAAEWLQQSIVDHVIIAAPWKPVVASIEKSCSQFQMMTRRNLFYGSGYQHSPSWEVTALTTTTVCSSKTIEAIKNWKRNDGWRFGLIIDEIHHNSLGAAWGSYAEIIAEHADYLVCMSGTPFRADGMPIATIEYSPSKELVRHYRLTYEQGVSEGYVRDVTVSWIRGNVSFFDKEENKTTERPYENLSKQQVAQVQDQLLDSKSELVSATILAVHEDLMKLRASGPEYEDAAALFVCRPGTNNGDSDKRVWKIARQIKALTGIDPEVVTHKDENVEGKIEAFRRGKSPYIVAVNMISEGCDIPRLIKVGILRLIDSPMLVRQVVGRVIRRRGDWDTHAATVYAPRISPMAEELEQLYQEGKAGVELRKPCFECGGLPCVCVKVCPSCGVEPCDCPRCDFCGRKQWQCACEQDARFHFIDTEAEANGGRFSSLDIEQPYIEKAKEVAFHNSQFRSLNPILGGGLLKAAGLSLKQFSTATSPEQNRRNLINKAERLCRRLAQLRYRGDERICFANEIIVRFSVDDWTEIRRKFASDNVQRIVSHLQHEIEKVLR